MSIFFLNGPMCRSKGITGNTHVNYQSSSTHNSNVINKVKVFKSRPDCKVKVTGQNCWFSWNGFVTIYIHVKY